MKPTVHKIIRITLAVVFAFFTVAYILDQEWAVLPWRILLLVVCLYNLIWNKPNTRDTHKDEND